MYYLFIFPAVASILLNRRLYQAYSNLTLQNSSLVLCQFKSSCLNKLEVLPSWNCSNLITESPCLRGSWIGIICDSSGVISINITNRFLNCSIPSSFGFLVNLTHISMSNNFLVGTLPSTIGN